MKTTNHSPEASPVRISSVPVAIYARVSTENQVGGRFDSCESQAAICREHLRKRADAGWQEFVCLTDAAYSGGTMERPGIQELKRLIAAGRVKVVLIYKLERVLRNTAEWGPFRAFLRQHDCQLESATEELSEGTPSGRFKNNILISAAEYERENTAEKTRIKMREQARRGYWNGGMVPFGYDYDAKQQLLVPSPTESPLVRRIFAEAAELRSLVEIANRLNAEGHRTKSRIWRRRDGREEQVGAKRFRDDGIRLILINPIYRGAVRFEGQEYPGNHEALVPEDLWENANAAIIKVQQPKAPGVLVHRDKHGNMLKGILRCGHCGCAMVPHASGKLKADGTPYRYYNCLQVDRKNRTGPCLVGRVTAPALEATVIEFLSQLAKHPEVVRSALADRRTERTASRKPIQETLKSTEARLTEADQRIRNLVDAIAAVGASAITADLVAQANRLRDEKQELMVQRDKLRQDLKACDQAKVAKRQVAEAVSRLSETLPHLNADEQKELLQLFLHRITVRMAPNQTSALRRGLSIDYQVALPKFLASMKDQVVVRLGLSKSRGGDRNTLSIGSTISLGARGASAIEAPFQHLVRMAPSIRPSASAEARHPIHRPLAWREQMQRDPTLQKQAIAKREQLTPGAVSHHFELLALEPAIQRFLRELTDPDAIGYFSLRKMRRLANLPVTQQRPTFREMRKAYGPGPSI